MPGYLPTYISSYTLPTCSADMPILFISPRFDDVFTITFLFCNKTPQILDFLFFCNPGTRYAQPSDPLLLRFMCGTMHSYPNQALDGTCVQPL